MAGEQQPDVGIAAVGPQSVHTYPVPGAGIVGVIVKDARTGETLAATVLTTKAARALAAQLMGHAADATPTEPLIVDGDAAYLTPDAHHG